ncbi:MAG: TonB-dependent receptor domain-containing protein [Vicinamibacterales bacterium]
MRPLDCLRAPAALAAVIAIASLAPVPADAAPQLQSSQLSVTVRDNTGVLPGASVVVTEAVTRRQFSAATDSEGVARFESLPPGTYDVRVSLPGFADTVERGVVVSSGPPRDVSVTLSVVQFATSVTVTTANRREELLMRVADPTTLIDSTQIADTGARSAKDILAEQTGSGIQVHAGGGQGHVSLNGIPNSGVLVLIDGRRYLGKDANGNLNLEDLQVSGIERIEVVKGAASALYGSDALGGVINLITSKATRPGATNHLTFSGGSYSDVRISDTVGYRRDNLGVTASGSYRNYNGFDLDPRNPQTIGQPESLYYAASGTADYRLRDRVNLRFFGDFSRRDIDNYFFSGFTQLGTTVFNSQRELVRRTLSPEVEVLATPTTTVGATANFGRYDRDETQVFSDRINPVAPWKEWNNEVKLTVRQLWPLLGRQHALQGGFEYRDETLDRGPALRVPGTDERRASREISVGWLQQEFEIGRPLKLIGGFRYDRYSDFGSKLSPKVSAVYSLGESQTVRASYGQGFRAPFFGELYLASPSFVGNPNLRPERSETFSAGYTFAHSGAQLSADYFRAQVKDGITFDLRGLPFTYMNLRSYTSQGANMSASVTLPYGFAPSFSYSFVRREDNNGLRVGGLPEHAAFIKLLWAHPRLGLRVNVRGQILDDVRFEDGTSQPSYQVWYGRVSKALFTHRGTRVQGFVQVDNLLNKKDIFRRSAAGQPIPGDYQVWLAPRTILAGFTFDLE